MLLSVKNLVKSFPITGGFFRLPVGSVQAVRNVSLELKPGETLGIVGESGCGKTTLGRTIAGLYEQEKGSITLKGQKISGYNKSIQMIFQDPFSSLNPRMTIKQILLEPFILNQHLQPKQRIEKISKLLDIVGLGNQALEKFPHEFSGGQRQRISIARSLCLDPQIIIADEPVSALDVSIQSQVLNLLLDLQKELKISLLFISHDLGVVRYISHRLAIMYLGEIVETGTADQIYSSPKHPYTQALLKAIPKPNPENRTMLSQVLEGDVPSPANPPSGCSFHTRCPHKTDQCQTQKPQFSVISEDQQVACHLYSSQKSPKEA